MSYDTWMHKGARVLVRPLVQTSVTPNQITACRLLTGLGAAVAVSWGTEDGRQLGAFLFVMSFILDRADGELARLTGRISPGGHTFDLWSDAICSALIFVGMGIGLRESELAGWAVPLGILAGGSIALMFWMLSRVESSDAADDVEIGSVAGFDPDDSTLVVPVTLLLGWAEGMLLVAAAVAPLVAILLFWKCRRHLQAQLTLKAPKNPVSP